MKTLRRIIAGAALAAAAAGPMLLPSPAHAWWHAPGYGGWRGGWGARGGWGWHPGWGWRPGWGWGPGYGVGVPPVVVGPPVYTAPGYAYRWVPGYWSGRVWVRPHWGYR
jgi:hypothetical protein